jgi:hypothetical protein
VTPGAHPHFDRLSPFRERAACTLFIGISVRIARRFSTLPARFDPTLPKKLATLDLDEKDRNPRFRRPMNNGTYYMPKCYGWEQAWPGSIRGRSKPSAR